MTQNDFNVIMEALQGTYTSFKDMPSGARRKWRDTFIDCSYDSFSQAVYSYLDDSKSCNFAPKTGNILAIMGKLADLRRDKEENKKNAEKFLEWKREYEECLHDAKRRGKTKRNEKTKTVPKTNEIIKEIEESKASINNNSKMIMKIANRVEKVKEKMDKVPTKTEKNLT